MKKEYVIFSVIFVIALFIFVIYSNQPKKESLCINDKACFNVELAKTSEERILGLSNRNSLKLEEGMLFIFPESDFAGFWMKDMNFPLDIIWINENSEITGFEKEIRPCETTENCPIYYSEEKIKYVLEINAGLSEIYRLEKGDKVFFRVSLK